MLNLVLASWDMRVLIRGSVLAEPLQKLLVRMESKAHFFFFFFFFFISFTNLWREKKEKVSFFFFK